MIGIEGKKKDLFPGPMFPTNHFDETRNPNTVTTSNTASPIAISFFPALSERPAGGLVTFPVMTILLPREDLEKKLEKVTFMEE